MDDNATTTTTPQADIMFKPTGMLFWLLVPQAGTISHVLYLFVWSLMSTVNNPVSAEPGLLISSQPLTVFSVVRPTKEQDSGTASSTHSDTRRLLNFHAMLVMCPGTVGRRCRRPPSTTLDGTSFAETESTQSPVCLMSPSDSTAHRRYLYQQGDIWISKTAPPHFEV